MLEVIPSAMLYGLYKLTGVITSNEPEKDNNPFSDAVIIDRVNCLDNMAKEKDLSGEELQFIANSLLELQSNKKSLQCNNFYFYFAGDKLKIEKVQEY